MNILIVDDYPLGVGGIRKLLNDKGILKNGWIAYSFCIFSS
jgi:hypothetical protein